MGRRIVTIAVAVRGASPEFASFDSGYDPADPVDQAIMATRNAVFPLNSLFP